MNIGQLIQQYGYLAVGVIVGLESLGIPLPGETTLVLAAIYAGTTHKLNIVGVILAAIVGAIIGDNIGYWIGHWGGYRLLVRYGRYVGLTQERVKVVRYMFRRFGGWVVFFGRFISILRAFAAFFAGTSRMPWWRFLIFNAAGAVVWATFWGTAGYVLGNEITRFSRALQIAFLVIGVIIIVAAVILIRRYERVLIRVAEDAYPGPLEGYPGGEEL